MHWKFKNFRNFLGEIHNYTRTIKNVAAATDFIVNLEKRDLNGSSMDVEMGINGTTSSGNFEQSLRETSNNLLLPIHIGFPINKSDAIVQLVFNAENFERRPQ
jgi:hypothetical protein